MSVADSLYTVVSVGFTRLFAGSEDGAGNASREAIVVAVVESRLINPASASVPVLTDQRSTPQLPVVERGRTTSSCSSASGVEW